ncbi:MAG: hypothetical protein Ta2F_18220 [Termitinemataceae bacterium]|nr:MAG: hypothetical protein Ta2F_18220 [Termitinemataceae bacterium]
MSFIGDCDFYTKLNDMEKEKYYFTHLKTCTYHTNNFLPLVFSKNTEGKLEIYNRGRYDENNKRITVLNPFSKDDIDTIKTLLKDGLEYNQYVKDDVIASLKESLPHLHDVVKKTIIQAEKIRLQNEGKKIEGQKPELSAPEQLKQLLENASENNTLPWLKEIACRTKEASYNPANGEQFAGNNFIATMLHMGNIKSNDPRFLRVEDIEDNGDILKDDAQPLKLCYRSTDKNGEYILKDEIVYNAQDIVGSIACIPSTSLEGAYITADRGLR